MNIGNFYMQLEEYGAKDHQKAGWTICVLRV